MGKELVLFKSEERKDLQSVADFLHQLADKLATREVVLRQGDEELKVILPPSVVLELKVEEESKKNKTKRSLEIEIEWMEDNGYGETVTLG